MGDLDARLAEAGCEIPHGDDGDGLRAACNHLCGFSTNTRCAAQLPCLSHGHALRVQENKNTAAFFRYQPKEEEEEPNLG